MMCLPEFSLAVLECVFTLRVKKTDTALKPDASS